MNNLKKCRNKIWAVMLAFMVIVNGNIFLVKASETTGELSDVLPIAEEEQGAAV